jgi:hypothetical protein
MNIKYWSCSIFRSRFTMFAIFCPDCTTYTYNRGARSTLFRLSAHIILVHFIKQNAFGVFWTDERNTSHMSNRKVEDVFFFTNEQCYPFNAFGVSVEDRTPAWSYLRFARGLCCPALDLHMLFWIVKWTVLSNVMHNEVFKSNDIHVFQSFCGFRYESIVKVVGKWWCLAWWRS